jgi:hypothetical protein
VFVTCLLLCPVALAGTARHHHHRLSPKAYARRLTFRTWHSNAQWLDLNAIIAGESGWDPCAHWPSVHHDCAYDGTVLCSGGACSNACGIPQATPCPVEWRGRLWATRFAQVRWLIAYVKRRYGTPAAALYAHSHGGY